MNLLINRDIQKAILIKLAEAYPSTLTSDKLGFDQGDRAWVANAMYLTEHGLITALKSNELSPDKRVIHAAATHKGIDFLLDDGGLSAILGVVTIRFEADTLKALIEAKIDAAEADPTLKERLKKALGSLTEDGLKEATKKLLELAWQNAPQGLQILETVLRIS